MCSGLHGPSDISIATSSFFFTELLQNSNLTPRLWKSQTTALPGKEKCVRRLLTLPRTTCASWQWELGFGAQLVPTCTCPPLPTSAHLCPPLAPAQHCHHHLKQPDWEAHNYSKPTTIAQGIKHVAPKASSHLLESRMHDAARGWGSRAQPSTWPQEVPLTGKVARGWVPL